MDETWKCPKCGFIPGTHVKFDETCEHCGSGVTPSEAVEGLEAANLRLTAQVEKYQTALREIEKGEGAFSRDPLEHAENTIDNMKDIAHRAREGKNE